MHVRLMQHEVVDHVDIPVGDVRAQGVVDRGQGGRIGNDAGFGVERLGGHMPVALGEQKISDHHPLPGDAQSRLFELLPHLRDLSS